MAATVLFLRKPACADRKSAKASGFLSRLAFLLFALFACPSANAGDLTADEMLAQAKTHYQQGEWNSAAELYEAFLANYGSAPEVAALLPGIRFDLALAQLQSKDFAAALETISQALSGTPPLSEPQKQELAFWKGICEMQLQEYPAARASLEQFLAMFPAPKQENFLWRKQFPAASKIPEARLLIGATWLLEGKSLEGANYLAEIKPSLSEENRGRATVLQLFGLIQAGETDPARLEEALAVVVEEFPSLDRLTQLVAFQTMTLQLGAMFLDRQEYRKAIRCLQRIWTAERLLKHQESRLADIKNRLEALEANPRSDPYQKFLLEQMRVKVVREIENFQTIENFDAALRLRLATAYQSMRRYREAALIQEEMLLRMPPSPIVESASVNLVQCWNAAERWRKVVDSVDRFEAVFPKSRQLPMLLYLRAIALQKESDYQDSIATFDRLIQSSPDSEFAPRARFMRGFTNLLAEENPAAIADFERFLKDHKNHDLEEAARYWRGMAYSLNGENEKTRTVMDEYLKAFPEGRFAGAAKFRKAYAAQQMMDFSTSIAELRAFLEEYPGHEQEAEALLLLGDACMNEGFMEEGIAAMKKIPPHQTRFFEEGWFKVGRAYKLMEQYDSLREHMREFRETYPDSPKVAEALFHEGWVHRQQGDEPGAKQIYWDAIEQFAGDPSRRSVEQLFPALARLHAGEDGKRQYLARLRDLREGISTDTEEGRTLLMRTLWAEAQATKKSDPDAAALRLLEASRLADVQTTNPMLLADFAQQRYQSGDKPGAEELYRELLRWNPGAPQKDQALAMLGILALENGKEKAAGEYFTRFERETSGSIFTGRVLLAKAGLDFERGRDTEARQSLESLLASNATSGEEKARALFLLGESHMRDNRPDLAIPYFQRIYVMYGRWRDWVARAYLRSGEAFEKLDDPDAARRTYAELVDTPGMETFPETSEARTRLDRLGPATSPAPQAEPAPASQSS